VGKSRLLDEFIRWTDANSVHNPKYFLGRATQQMIHTPYALLNDLLANRFDIRSSDSTSQACMKLQEGVGPYLEEEPVLKVHFIGALAGYRFPDSPYLMGVKDDPIQFHDRALMYLGEFSKP
jgi:hypothetical protein